MTDWYEKRKEQGLCPKCGKPLDRQGLYCNDCKIKVSENSLQNYHFYIEQGICPRCRKNKLFGDEKACLECKAKVAEQRQRSRENNRVEYNKNQRIYRQARYEKNKEQGLCVACGKPLDDSRYVKCSKCREKYNTWKRTKYGAKIPKGDRYLYGLCTYCDNEPLKGMKSCQEHYERMIIKPQRARLENEMEVFVERMNLAKYPTDTLDEMRDKLNLTEDEEEIFNLLAKAKTIKEISLEVGLSTRTVDNRIANIRSKMRQIGIVI